MEILATLEETTPVTSGVGRNGNSWRVTEAVVLTTGNYPKRFRLKCFNETCDRAVAIQNGTLVRIRFSIEEREVPANGDRKAFWVNDVTCHSIIPYVQQAMPQQYQQPQPNCAGGYVQQTSTANQAFMEMPVQTNIQFKQQVLNNPNLDGPNNMP